MVIDILLDTLVEISYMGTRCNNNCLNNMEPNGTRIVYVWVKNPYGYNNGVPKASLTCSNNYVIICFWNILKLVSIFFLTDSTPKKPF